MQNNPSISSTRSPSAHERLLDLAHARAATLRDQAFDQFVQACGDRARRAGRAARRLAHSLMRHAHLRARAAA